MTKISVDEDCYTGSGHKYRGQVNVTSTNMACINWLDKPDVDMPEHDKEAYGIGNHNYCRNPDPSPDSKTPWCYVSPKTYGYCAVEACKLALAQIY